MGGHRWPGQMQQRRWKKRRRRWWRWWRWRWRFALRATSTREDVYWFTASGTVVWLNKSCMDRWSLDGDGHLPCDATRRYSSCLFVTTAVDVHLFSGATYDIYLRLAALLFFFFLISPSKLANFYCCFFEKMIWLFRIQFSDGDDFLKLNIVRSNRIVLYDDDVFSSTELFSWFMLIVICFW